MLSVFSPKSTIFPPKITEKARFWAAFHYTYVTLSELQNRKAPKDVGYYIAEREKTPDVLTLRLLYDLIA